MKSVFVTVCLAVAGLLTVAAISGCETDENPPMMENHENHEGHDHMDMQADDRTQSQINGNEQTTCPVMGGKIDKSISTEYKGKTIYFCCAGCIEEFKKNPEKYLDKLPQFQQDASQEQSVEPQSSVQQTTCPVMGGKINTELFVEYQDKKVYFCCPGCSDTFEADPTKYIADLPQFNS